MKPSAKGFAFDVEGIEEDVLVFEVAVWPFDEEVVYSAATPFPGDAMPAFLNVVVKVKLVNWRP